MASRLLVCASWIRAGFLEAMIMVSKKAATKMPVKKAIIVKITQGVGFKFLICARRALLVHNSTKSKIRGINILSLLVVFYIGKTEGKGSM